MKSSLCLALLCAAVLNTHPAWAGDDSEQASDLAATGVLASAATPLVLTKVGIDSAVHAGKGIVKIVDKTGTAIGDLTSDIIDDYADALDCTSPKVTVEKKDIPLVVRKDYVELNEKVNP